MVLHHKEFCGFPVFTHFPYSKETGETTKSLGKVIISRNFVFSCFWSLISSRLRKRLLFKNKSHMMGLFSTVPGCTWLCPIVPGCTLAYHDLPFQRIFFESLGFCHTLEILGDGFLEMDGHWWSCLMIFILFFEIILRLMYPKSQNGVVVHVYNDMCKHV